VNGSKPDIQQPRGCAVKKTLVFWLVVMCATALFLGVAAVASAEEPPQQEVETQAWQVRTIDTPVTGVVPSFVSASGGILAWTGAKPGGYSNMYVFDLVTGVNTTIKTGLPGKYYNPSADGPWVVYQGGRAGAYDDIYYCDIGNGTVTQVTYNNPTVGDTNDWNPRIDAGRIVWEKDMTGSAAKPGIYLYRIDMGTIECIMEGDEYRDPDISGDYVVCTKAEETGLTTEIILYSLVTKEIRSIADSTKANEDPRIDGELVVWSSHDAYDDSTPNLLHTYQVHLYDIPGDTATQLTNDVAGNSKPSVKEGLIAWMTKVPSGIVVYEAEQECNYQLPARGDTAGAPEVDGSGVAWVGTKGLYYALPASEATLFPDVPAEHPYIGAIESIADQGIIEGYKNGNFGPSNPITRQQFAKMIVLTMAVNDPGRYTATTSDTFEFTDSSSIERVQGELYPYHYVAKAALTGLTVGYTDGKFRPFSNISRQQVITMIVRAGSQVLQPPPASYRGQLSYANAEHGQRIRLAEYNGLLSGIAGPVSPDNLAGWDTTKNATRGEVAQMLFNLLGKLCVPE